MILIGVRKDLGIEMDDIQPVLNVEERIPVRNILLSREEIDENYPNTYLSEKAIAGIIKKKEKSKKAGKGFGAQFFGF